jgi:hypothetical protein
MHKKSLAKSYRGALLNFISRPLLSKDLDGINVSFSKDIFFSVGRRGMLHLHFYFIFILFD